MKDLNIILKPKSNKEIKEFISTLSYEDQIENKIKYNLITKKFKNKKSIIKFLNSLDIKYEFDTFFNCIHLFFNNRIKRSIFLKYNKKKKIYEYDNLYFFINYIPNV